MDNVVATQKITGLKKSLADIDERIRMLQKQNYHIDGPKFATLEAQRARIAAELTQAEQQELNQAA